MTEVETRARIQQIRDSWTPQRTGITTICFIDVEWLCDQLEAVLAAGTFAEGVEAAAAKCECVQPIYQHRCNVCIACQCYFMIRALQPPKPPAMEPQPEPFTGLLGPGIAGGVYPDATPAEPAASNSLDFYPPTPPHTDEGFEMTIKNEPTSGSGERSNMFIEAGSLPKEVDGIPRRCRIDLSTPAETAIRAAVRAVEVTGCDERLTDAVVLLSQAQDKVADYLEGIERATAPPAANVDMNSLKWCLETIRDVAHCLPINFTGARARLFMAAAKVEATTPAANVGNGHGLRRAEESEQVDCCGDKFACHVEFVCSCGKHLCDSHMRRHLLEAALPGAAERETK